jgi:histidine triad (HIT) family protein
MSCQTMSSAPNCTFCRIASGAVAAAVVFETPKCLAFLDHRPLFPGHCLVIPRVHHELLIDLPDPVAAELFAHARRLSAVMEDALGAEGAFVAINNRVSQSVPHVHIHVVPRRKGDGLKGFFWPRRPYRDDAEMEAVRAELSAALQRAPNPVPGD